MTTPQTPHPRVVQKPQRLEHGATVKDADGSKWRVIMDLSNGRSRVRVGSLAEEVIFGKT